MKITTCDAIYIQKSDLFYLKEIRYPIPKKINNIIYRCVIIGEDSTSDFVKFTEPDDIEFFSKMDWIFEYDSILNMSLDDINRYSEEANDEQNEIYKNNKGSREKIDRCDILNLKIKSLRDALLFKNGSLKITMPKELKIFYGEQEVKKGFMKRLIDRIIK